MVSAHWSSTSRSHSSRAVFESGATGLFCLDGTLQTCHWRRRSDGVGWVGWCVTSLVLNKGDQTNTPIHPLPHGASAHQQGLHDRTMTIPNSQPPNTPLPSLSALFPPTTDFLFFSLAILLVLNLTPLPTAVHCRLSNLFLLSYTLPHPRLLLLLVFPPPPRHDVCFHVFPTPTPTPPAATPPTTPPSPRHAVK